MIFSFIHWPEIFCFQLVLRFRWDLQFDDFGLFGVQHAFHGLYHISIGFGRYYYIENASTRPMKVFIKKRLFLFFLLLMLWFQRFHSKYILYVSATATYWLQLPVAVICICNQRFKHFRLLLFRENGHRKLSRHGQLLVWSELAWISGWNTKILYSFYCKCTETRLLSWIENCDIGLGDVHQSELRTLTWRLNEFKLKYLN